MWLFKNLSIVIKSTEAIHRDDLFIDGAVLYALVARQVPLLYLRVSSASENQDKKISVSNLVFAKTF